MNYFEKKVIWITGASSGIGKALSLELSKYNPILILSSRNKNELDKIRQQCEENGAKAFVQFLDLENNKSIEQAVKNIISKYQKVDILFNNGGISQRSFVEETQMSVYKKIMEVNFFGTIYLTKLLLPYMLENKNGHIVVTTSVSGKFGFYNRSAYSASKHALHGFFESLYFENVKKGINVSLIVPGRTRTNVGRNALTKDGLPINKEDNFIEKGMSPRKCAKKIIKAVKRKKYETIIGKADTLLVPIKRFFPGLFRLIVKNIKPR